MSELSPATQAVLEAAWTAYLHELEQIHHTGDEGVKLIAAAVISAAADQVAPSDADEPRNCLPMALECQRIRAEILAIADELKAS